MHDPYQDAKWRALMESIRATPDDDLIRLVAADWLEENGQSERAEFIRVQCELARWTDPLKCPQCGEGYDYSCEMDGRAEGGGFKPTAELGCLNDHFWKYGDIDDLRRRELELWCTPGFEGKFTSLTTCVLHDSARTQLRLGTEYGPLLSIRRGFVAEVRCRLADWCGGECHQCAGTGRSFPIVGPTIPCRRCGGSLVTGIGPRIVREHPVERVVPTGLEPWEPWTGGTGQEQPTGYHFAWWRESAWGGRNSRGNLPDVVFDLLGELYPDNRLHCNGTSENQHIGFSTSDAAYAALSATIIVWAKRVLILD